MSTFNAVRLQAMTGNIPFVGHRFGDKLRFVAGLGVNVTGAGVMLAEVLRPAGWSA